MPKESTQFKKGHKPANKKIAVVVSCLNCKSNFNVQPYRKTTAKFCSHSCKAKLTLTGHKPSEETKLKISVGNKGKKMSDDSRQKMSKSKTGVALSIEHRKNIGKSLMGEKSNFWKGGISFKYNGRYHSFEYKEWRKSVFERDNFICRECGSVGYITAHHIKSFAHYPELRFDVNNGITLCEPCHSKTDNYKGRGRIKKLTTNLCQQQ